MTARKSFDLQGWHPTLFRFTGVANRHNAGCTGTASLRSKLAVIVHPDVHIRRASEIDEEAEREGFRHKVMRGMNVLSRCWEIVEHEKDRHGLLLGKSTEIFELGGDVGYSTTEIEAEQILSRHE